MTEEREFRTPHGKPVRLLCRPGTNDQMMAYSCLDEDEYRLRDIPAGTLTLAADVGAHIGMVAIGLALDHPGARVLAVEPLPANIALLEENAHRNGVGDRVTVIWGAASRTKGNVDIAWSFAGDEAADMHRFVGNQPMAAGTKQETLTVPGVTLASLVTTGALDLLVTDCEGGEYDLLAGKTAKARVREIRGEYHGGFTRLEGLLADTHDVEAIGGTASFGGFIARART